MTDNFRMGLTTNAVNTTCFACDCYVAHRRWERSLRRRRSSSSSSSRGSSSSSSSSAAPLNQPS